MTIFSLLLVTCGFALVWIMADSAETFAKSYVTERGWGEKRQRGVFWARSTNLLISW